MMVALIRTKKRIRPLTQEDVTTLMQWSQDPELQRLTGRTFPSEKDGALWWHAVERDPTRLAMAILDDDGQFIGDVELENVAWRAGEAELRIAIGEKSCWNRGYGTEALSEMAQIAFKELHLHSLYLRVSERNVRAIRSYHKAGFRKVARLSATGRLQGGDPLVLMRRTRVDVEETP